MATAQLNALMRHIKGLAPGVAGRHRTDRQLLDDFAARRDEQAFAGLVRRHGGMVLRVCRRVLRHEQDAEDAFQATFLVLARDAASIRRRDALASWLYGVAYRTAMEAKRKAARRRNREARLRGRTPPAAPSPTWDDVRAVLDEEIQRLPESFRAAFVCCVLDGKTVPAAAAELGVKAGTLSWRLARARQRLRQRLARRGIQLSAVLAALAVASGAGEAAVPAALASATVRFGLSVAAGEPAAAIPTHVAALAAGVTRAMFVTRVKVTTFLLLAAGLLIAGAGALARQALAAGGPPPGGRQSQVGTQQPATAATKPAPADEKADAVEVRGRVVDPDGKPVSGAALSLWAIEAKREARRARQVTGTAGRFRITVRGTDLERRATLVATAEGYGPDWAELPHSIPENHEVTLRLARDDVPVGGRLLTLEGRGIAGVTVSVRVVEKRVDDGDLAAVIATKRQWARGNYINGPDMKNLGAAALPAATSVTTDAGGRFRLTGLGRERVVHLTIEGKAIEPIYVEALTRTGPVEGLYSGNVNDTVYGATFERVIPPGKSVAGTVREKGTGKPLAGIRVSCGRLAATTDAAGRYRIDGPRKRNEYSVTAYGVPYFDVTKNVADTPAFEPVKADFELERGQGVSGHVLDKVTGKPVGATITYLAFADNPYLKTVSGLGPGGYVRDDGSFAFTALPGPGVLAVIADEDDYLKVEPAAGWKLVPGINWFPGLAHAFVRIDPSERDPKSATFEIRLEPAASVRLAVVGPDDKPFSGYHAAGLTGAPRITSSYMVPRESPTVTVRGLGARRPRTVVLYSAEKKLGKALVLRGDEADPLRARLEPLSSLTGRALDATGRPLSGLHVRAALSRTGGDLDRLPVQFFITRGTWAAKLEAGARTDAEGKFRLDGLMPGLKYTLVASADGSDDPDRVVFRRDGLAPAEAGHTQELGDLRSTKESKSP
jgi:RNA polymerase sigma factor (sigma-70 family)